MADKRVAVDGHGFRARGRGGSTDAFLFFGLPGGRVMAFGLTRSRLSPIAIDPGADQLKLLQVAGGEPPQLVAMAAEPVPASARGDAAEWLAFIEDALPRLLQQGGFRGRRAMWTIPAFNTYVHHLDIATNQKVSQQDQLESQLRERLNVEPTRMVVRSFDVGPVQRSTGPCQRMIALAAKRDKVMKYVDLARRCRLEVVGMHSEPLCVVRAFSHLFRRETDQQRATCFVDMGASTTKVTIAHGREMIFTKTIQAGGEQTLQTIAKARSISLDQARELHLAGEADAAPAEELADEPASASPASALDSPQSVPTGAGTERAGVDEGAAAAREGTSVAAGPALAEPADADAAAHETIVDELRLCLRYHGRLFPDRAVERLVFVGGAAHRRARCRAIAQATGVAGALGDPLAVCQADPRAAIVGVDPSAVQPGWAVAVGLSQCEANW